MENEEKSCKTIQIVNEPHIWVHYCSTHDCYFYDFVKYPESCKGKRKLNKKKFKKRQNEECERVSVYIQGKNKKRGHK